MATTAAELAIKVTSDASAATRDLDGAAGNVGKFQSSMSKAALGAAAIAGGIAVFGKAAFDAASEAQQAGGAVDAVFGRSAKSIHKWAQSSADDVGLATSDYEQLAATFGASLKNMGVSSKKLAPTTDKLITLGADLAAQYGGSTADAVAALGSLMRGETDPIERYGVSIKQADVEAKKAEMGLSDLTGEAGKQADMQAKLALLTEQTASATGAFAREADTAAGQQQRANAQWKNAQAALGQALLPLVSKAAKLISVLSKFVQENSGTFQILVGVLGGAAVAIWAVNAAMAANPVTLIIAGIAALTAGIVILVKNWDKVTAAFRWAFEWLKSNWPKLVAILTGPFGVAVLLIIKNWRKVLGFFKGVGRVIVGVFRKVRDVVVAVFRRLVDVVKKAVSIYINLWRRYLSIYVAIFRKVRDIAVAVFRAIRDTVRTVMAAIRDAIVRVIDAVRRVVDFVRGRFADAWRAIRDTVRAVMSAIRDAIVRVIDAAKRVAEWVRTNLAAAFRAVRDVVKAVMAAIREAIGTVIDKAKTVVTFLGDTLEAAFESVEAVAVGAFNAMKAPIDAIASAIGFVIDKVDSLIGWLGKIKVPDVGGLIDKINPFRALPPVGGVAAAPAVAGFGRRTVATRRTTVGGGAGVVINVSGALDPDAVARQIQHLLTRRSRRVGGVDRRAG